METYPIMIHVMRSMAVLFRCSCIESSCSTSNNNNNTKHQIVKFQTRPVFGRQRTRSLAPLIRSLSPWTRSLISKYDLPASYSACRLASSQKILGTSRTLRPSTTSRRNVKSLPVSRIASRRDRARAPVRASERGKACVLGC